MPLRGHEPMTRSQATLNAVGLVVCGAILIGFGVWQLAGGHIVNGVLPISFAVFGIAVGLLAVYKAR